MNLAAAHLIAQDFLRGFFDTIDALMAVGVTSATGDPEEASAESITTAIETFSVSMRGKIENTGYVVVLMTPKDSMYFAATVMGETPPEGDITALPAESLPSVREVFDSCLGGGCGTLKDTCSAELAFTDADVKPLTESDVKTLFAELGESAGQIPFTFEAPNGLGGEGVVLVASSVVGLLPDDVIAGLAAGPPPGGASITDEEMGDILGGFDPEIDGTKPSRPTKSEERNLEMVMDIKLVCTARLGRITMPIGEILQLGPGSIIEVGHLVDEPVELLVNDKLIARGDVVVVDEKFGLRITEIVSQAERIKSLQ